MNLALFDFDGTITRHDTFIDFLIFCFGRVRSALIFFRLTPWVILYLLKQVRNDVLKQKVLSAFFRGVPIEQVRCLGGAFARDVLPKRVKESAMERLHWHRSEGHRIILVSASLDVWLEPWCREQSIELISSRLQVKDGLVTGRLDGENCYGPEKERRIRSYLNPGEFELIYAYGDSRGDTEMLGLSQKPYFRYFN